MPEIQARWDDLDWDEERASARGRQVSPPPLPSLEPIDEDTPESEPQHRIEDDETPDSLPEGPLQADDMPDSEPPLDEQTERMESHRPLKKRDKRDERALEFEEPRRNDMWLLALAVAVAVALWYWLTKR